MAHSLLNPELDPCLPSWTPACRGLSSPLRAGWEPASWESPEGPSRPPAHPGHATLEPETEKGHE